MSGGGGRFRVLNRAPRSGLSLLEVLVVIGVVILLMAVLLPNLDAARERARRVVCSNNLRQWGVALQFYRDDVGDYLPTEGSSSATNNPQTWYNTLPPYLNLPRYREIEGVGEWIRERPQIDPWICPSKNLIGAYKSDSGKNQFHYGMNQVLDGMGTVEKPSPDTPDFPEQKDKESDPIPARWFDKEPHTVFMFDIAPNSPSGSPRNVATQYMRDYANRSMGRFHGDYANILYISGGVVGVRAEDIVVGRDFRRGSIRWNHPKLYWGYRPPAEAAGAPTDSPQP